MKIDKHSAIETTRSFKKSFGYASPDLYGEVTATAAIVNGKFETSVYCPWSHVPGDSVGDIIRALQVAAEWVLDQEAALRK